MVHRSTHRSKRRARFAIGSLLAGLVLALSIGSFASIAAADDVSSSSGDVSALTVEPTPSANNPLPDKCGLNIVMIIDRSGSTAPADQDYKDAANAFVDSLVGTPSHIGAVTFSSSASVLSGYQDVSSNAGTLHTLINALGTPSGFTNWQDALEVTTANFTSPVPDLALFITDGNPTTHNGSGTDLGNGITAANTLKSNGTTHITGVGVGVDVNAANIAKITGAGVGLGGLDPDVHTSDTTTLVKDLTALATEICGGSVTIHKQVRTGPNTIDSTTSGLVDGWAFSNGDAVSGTTGDDGTGLVNLKFGTDQLGANTLTESAGLAGYSIESVTCDNEAKDHTATSFDLSVSKLDIINCTVVNTPDLASITLNKITTHGVGGAFSFHVTGGPGSVDLTRSATTTQQNTSTPTTGDSLAGLFPGSYNIAESSPTGWALTGIVCTDAAGQVDPPNVDGDITLGIGENLVCTYTNDEQAVDLSIVKTASGLTSINGGADRQLDYTLTVDNNGPGDAHNDATVTDVLPSVASLVSISPPAGVTCGSSSQTITCNIPADQLEVADGPVVIGIRITVPTSGETITNKTIVDSPDDPAPCTVTSDDITCSETTNNYSEVSTDIPNPAFVPGVPSSPSGGSGASTPVQVSPATATVSPAQVQVEAAQAALAFTGSSSSVPFAWIGALLVAIGAFALVLSRRRRNGTVTE